MHTLKMNCTQYSAVRLANAKLAMIQVMKTSSEIENIKNRKFVLHHDIFA